MLLHGSVLLNFEAAEAAVAGVVEGGGGGGTVAPTTALLSQGGRGVLETTSWRQGSERI